MSSDDPHGIESAGPALFERDREGSESERHGWNFKQRLPVAMRPPDRTRPPNFLLDARFYSMKKTAMTLMCLLMIIMSNSVQLKHVLKQGSLHSFYGTQVTLGIISILMCTSIGVVLMYVMRVDYNDQYKHSKLDYIDNCVICLLFILGIFNIFITACS
ncbi:hypothetical protein I4U23_024322 [Adineta vaga]|nr:hypothetical protein I4U23_024322 [Adineta vaga]